jgi:hypothetical protein
MTYHLDTPLCRLLSLDQKESVLCEPKVDIIFGIHFCVSIFH